MRIVLIVILCTSSVCLAQESFHNDEFGFALEVPVGWNISFEDQWSNEDKKALKHLYDGKTLLMLNPSSVKAPKAPCIQVQGRKLQKITTSLKETGKKFVTYSAEYLAKSILGRKADEYHQIDTFYNYDSSRKVAIAKILYKHKRKDIYFLSARAKFIGRQRVIDFRGYWRGDDPESFWQIFNEVVDSFEFDHDTGPKGSISEPITLRRVMKWGSIILTISIILGFVKMARDRYF